MKRTFEPTKRYSEIYFSRPVNEEGDIFFFVPRSISEAFCLLNDLKEEGIDYTLIQDGTVELRREYGQFDVRKRDDDDFEEPPIDPPEDFDNPSGMNKYNSNP